MESEEHRLTHHINHRSTPTMQSVGSCKTVRIMTHEVFAARHPHPSQPYRVTTDDIDRQQQSVTDRPTNSGEDRQQFSSSDRHPQFSTLNALKHPSKPSETSVQQSEDAAKPMIIDHATEGQTLRRRK
ncbi:hypothetical protein DY000_02015904 [Brassica cretica]|uniref:Uncharacterized protein n=1 Tax=Brassica cretica TaxID=69181 RepID=A0ABQ7CZ54_BRACR|nr:hypothetical protein DY000_02015904 [Brassica cretica]